MKVLLLIAIALPFITCERLLGGPQKYNADLTDPFVDFAINGINEFYKANGDQRPRVGERIVSSTSQLVAGVKYSFKIEVSGGDVNEVCDVKVLNRLWMPEPEKTTLIGQPTCAPKV